MNAFLETSLCNKPTIDIKPGHLEHNLQECESILRKCSNIYVQEDRLIRTCRVGESIICKNMELYYLSQLLSCNAIFRRKVNIRSDWTPCDCPDLLARALLYKGEWDLPRLKSVICAPTILQNGTVVFLDGYDACSELFLNLGKQAFLAVKATPTKEDAVEALESIAFVFKDFPFYNEASLSVVLSAVLTGMCRKSLHTAPLHAFTAPKMGTGKSLLASAISLIVTGKETSIIAQACNESEESKRLLAVLQDGDPIVCIDNIDRPFGSSTLCSILTEPTYKGRILGRTQNAVYSTKSLFLATGNNLVFQGDISTRVLLSNLDAEVQKPEQRHFDVDLHKYIPEHRSELVMAALTVLKAYIVAGRPKLGLVPFGRFEEWSNWVRSAIVWCGFEDPCSSRRFVEEDDPVRATLAKLLSSWHALVGDVAARIKIVYQYAMDTPGNDSDAMLEVLEEISGPGIKGKICFRKVGQYLKKHNRRIEGGYRAIKSGLYQNAETWRVEKVDVEAS